jgi:nucleoside phosphorylase
MAIELAGIRRSIRDPNGRGVTFRVIGIGKEPAQYSINQLVDSPPEAMVLVGFCGGADPALVPGDLHVARSFLHPASGTCVAADDGLASGLVHSANRVGLRVVSGTSATVDAVAGSNAKLELYKTTGTASVNMEDYWAARVANSAGVPFASIRAVLDTACSELPSYLTGNPDNIGPILRSLIVRPGRFLTMVRLAPLVRTANANLTQCMLQAIESLSPLRADPSVVS